MDASITEPHVAELLQRELQHCEARSARLADSCPNVPGFTDLVSILLSVPSGTTYVIALIGDERVDDIAAMARRRVRLEYPAGPLALRLFYKTLPGTWVEATDETVLVAHLLPHLDREWPWQVLLEHSAAWLAWARFVGQRVDL